MNFIQKILGFFFGGRKNSHRINLSRVTPSRRSGPVAMMGRATTKPGPARRSGMALPSSQPATGKRRFVAQVDPRK